MLDVNTEKFYANQSAQHTAIRERLGTAYDVNMRWEAKRLKSFLTCKRISFWAPMEMASAGMYYTGVEDSMQCFCCGIVLFCTRLTLTPREQHLQLNPSCGFIQGKDVGNIAKYEVRVQTSETGQESAEAYSTEEARLSSYTNWPFYAKIQPVHLASAGFYFTGRRDIVQCFSCAGCLGHWEENDDPWKEHSKWFPECNFLISKKPPDEIKVLINSYNGFPGFTGKHFLTGVIGSTEPCQPSYTKMSLFQDENVRLESFKKWPSDAKKDTASIARAGFYYTGRGDIVLCISCAGCVYNWEENDEPCKEHAKFIPDCPFLLKTETTPEDLKNPDEEKKDVHMKVSDSITYNKFCPVEVMELRKSLMELYNNPTFRKSFPFPGSSHVSIDLSLLFADVFFALKSVTNRTLNVLTLPEILTDLNDITMIEGEAGSGKSALLRKIAILWASGSCPVLSRFSLVFYISLSSTGREQTMSDIICQQLIGSSTSLTEDSLAEMIKQFKNQVLFLLDDYGMIDSSPESIEELIKMNHWNRVSLAVTVNPDKGRNLRQYARTILSIQDFPTCSSIFFLKNLFSHNLSIVDRITNELISTDTLRLVLKSPLFAFCLCVLWVQDPAEKISGDMMVWKSYLMHVMLRYPTEREKINAVVSSCEEFAIESIFKLRFEFTHEDLRESAVNVNDAVKYKILSMFTAQRLRPIFKFLHPSFQEFLAGKRMNELLQSGDATEKERGLSFLQSINTISKVHGRFFYFLKYTCMHSPETTAMVISHMFSLLESREVFHGQRDKKDIHLQQHPELKVMDISDNLFKEMDIFKSLINVPGMDSHDYMIEGILSAAIAIANESNHLPHCVPILLMFLKGKTISVLLSKPNMRLLGFLHRYPEGLSLMERMEIHVPQATMGLNLNFLTSESFRSMWPVPTVDEDYYKAFELSSDLLKRARMPELDYMGVNIDDLSTLGFTPDIHRIMSLTVKVHGCPVESDNILVNIMFFCSLSTQIDLDLNSCPGFLENLWPCIDEYKTSIASLSITFTKLTVEDQELITHLTALQSLKIISMPPPEFVLLNIQAFKALKELVVCCPMDDNKWEVIDLLSDEFKSMHNIEKIVFENINMERHAGRLASFIEHFHNLISFKMECKYCPGIGNIINSLCRNGKLQELRFPELLFHNQEIIHLGSALPSLRNLKILEIEFDYSAKAEPVIAFVEGLACLEHLEEFTFPGGDGVRETMTSFIQTLQHMPKLANLTIQRRLLNDSSLLELAKIIAAGHLRNLQKLDLDNNLHITQSGWRDFFLLLDNLPKLTVLHISRTISHQYVTDPVTFITLTQSVSRLHSLETLSMLGWLLDDKDIEMFDSMKMKHPQSKVLTLFWKWTLPFSPVLTK
ncbi:baculoviral IAP repeat-containing protein 1 isoform X1 [Bufo gargarizans]|uniref:baculoviral IAP repeat-containing protein 1 isoform X1 n=2 Tax=Bufo gargarizans TaxID=30331 RepID=UPI001CF3DE92|nr:baculoviral IAP repeat-containing protein 1 isoform X1 [Bufo gargarizans]